jgi:HD-like signal output (HDOD) protein
MTFGVATPVYPDAIDQVVARAGALYTLPAVAVEVLRLTELPRVDVHALKACIERDPALTIKILRVVNSSLFGLPREVSDLNQALALLGIKPLKLLALGFSLPEGLFLSAAREQLDWYWKTSLVRAVAAREISEQLFQKPGDDAFLAGLLQDIGVLVLLGDLRQPYAALVSEAIAAPADLADLERRALGFDHRQLTAGLLQHWNLPLLLTAAIGAEHDTRYWARNKAEHAHLVRVLHLAELFAQLIGQRRLSVLPDLLDAGDAYCELDKAKLNEVIATLEPKVRQLANVLSLQFAGGEDYTQIIVQAHAQMSEVAESAAAPLSRSLADTAANPIEGDLHETPRVDPGSAIAGFVRTVLLQRGQRARRRGRNNRSRRTERTGRRLAVRPECERGGWEEPTRNAAHPGSGALPVVAATDWVGDRRGAADRAARCDAGRAGRSSARSGLRRDGCRRRGRTAWAESSSAVAAGPRSS